MRWQILEIIINMLLSKSSGTVKKPFYLSLLALRLFAGPLDFPGGCGGDLSLPAGIKCVDVLWAVRRFCSGMCSAACAVYTGGLHKEE